ncbi:MAG: Rrf2 family transcriptional regulator [Ruminiclostridium sp.]|nr:Rrf2 family transcriptional regulator [Ruminiclostridium sp.]
MKISTKGRYALRMLFDIVRHSDEEAVSLSDISTRQLISKKYLEQIVPLLSRAGIIRASRGNRGGYSLAVNPDRLTVGDVLRATEGSLAPVACLEIEPNDCPHIGECPTLFIWEGLYDTVEKYLDGITISDIASRDVPDQMN